MFGVSAVVKAGKELYEGNEERKFKKIELADRRHERELSAASKAIERAALAEGVKGLWRPILLIVLTFLTGWFFVQAFIMFGTYFWHQRFGGGPGLTGDERFLIGEYVGLGTTLLMVLGAFGGVTSWSRGQEKIAGKAGGGMGAIEAVKERLQDNEADVVTKPIEQHTGPIKDIGGIVVPKRKAESRPEPEPTAGFQAVSVSAEPVNIKGPKPEQKIYDWKWSERSMRRLKRAHPELQQIFEWILPRSPYDLGISETTRTVAKQKTNIAKGLSKTMRSRHLETPAMAVDFYLINPKTGKAEWNDTDMYTEVLLMMKAYAAEVDIPLVCGGLEWQWDFFHTELSRKVYAYNGPDEVKGLA